MRLPWWSLVSGFAATRDLAGLQGGAIEVHRALTEQTMAANGALPPGAMPAKDSRQVRLQQSAVCARQIEARTVKQLFLHVTSRLKLCPYKLRSACVLGGPAAKLAPLSCCAEAAVIANQQQSVTWGIPVMLHDEGRPWMKWHCDRSPKVKL